MNIKDLTSGLWIATSADLITNLLISIKGEVPFLEISNAMDMNAFDNGDLEFNKVITYKELKGLIFNRLEASIRRDDEPSIKESLEIISKWTDKDTELWREIALGCKSVEELKLKMIQGDIPKQVVDARAEYIYNLAESQDIPMR